MRWTVLLTCALAAPAAAQTAAAPQPDSVLLAQTLAQELTAIDARRPAARAAVLEWRDRVERCRGPRLRSRDARGQLTSARAMAAHTVALQALAPDLERLAARLRALPVSDPAVRGGIRELLLDYRNAKRMVADGPADICRLERLLRRGAEFDARGWDSEDVRGSLRGLDLRESRLGAAQQALLRIEADPQLARALDALFSHITAGLHGPTVSGHREVLVPPFFVVVDPAELARLRAEAATLTQAVEPLARAQQRVARRLRRTLGRGPACTRVLEQGLERRRKGVAWVYLAWSVGELTAATAEPISRFRQSLAQTAVSDRTLAGIVDGVDRDLRAWDDVPRVSICSVLRTWRRHAWSRRHTPPQARGGLRLSGGGHAWSGIRLDDEPIRRAVLARRGMPREAVAAFLDPLSFLVATAEPDVRRDGIRAVRAPRR